MQRKGFLRMFLLLALAAGLADTQARIKLITLPVREHVEIQLENPRVTIVEEERIVPLSQGINTIDFSWHNTAVRPETIVFRVLPENTGGLKINILSVSYPPGEAALTWNVSSSDQGTAKVRITYAIEGMTRRFHYLANTDIDERHLHLSQFVKVENSANEAFAKATVNSGFGKPVELPLDIAETQEILLNRFAAIPVVKSYTVNAADYGYRDRAQDKLNVLMHYNLHNDKAHNLGLAALPEGKVRIFQMDSQQSLVFLGEDWGKYTPPEGKSHLYVGQARDIVVKRIIERKERERINGNLYNIDVLVKYEIENFKDQPVELTLEESLRRLREEVFSSRNALIEWQTGSDNSFASKPLEEKTSADSVAYKVALPAKTAAGKPVKVVRKLHIIFNNEW